MYGVDSKLLDTFKRFYSSSDSKACIRINGKLSGLINKLVSDKNVSGHHGCLMSLWLMF